MEKLLSNYDKMVINSEREDTAKKMLDKDLDIQTIIEVTGLPEAKIKTLAKKPTKEAA